LKTAIAENHLLQDLAVKKKKKEKKLFIKVPWGVF